MKKLLYIVMLFPVLVLGQTQTENYVKTTIYREISSANPVHSITYFDGLGRPIQQISNAQSNTGKDIVTPIEYDALGRQVKEYLPFVSSSSASLNIKQNEVMSYYGSNTISLTGNPNFETTTNPFSEKLLEASPLNRILKQAAPGNGWAMGQGHEVRLNYQTNDTLEVRKLKANTSWNSNDKLYSIGFTTGGYYLPKQLYKTITKDENWISGNNNTTEEFKDKEGRVVLKRTYSDYLNISGTVIDSEVAHDTYYVYDDYGNLTYVLPPLVNLNTVDANVLDDLCYQYKYDHRNRLVEKKLPGKQWEYIVYNSQDKPVATGPAPNPFDGNNEGWLITKYDVFGRVVYTGWKKTDDALTSNGRKQFQDNLSDANWAEHYLSSPVTIDGFTVNYSKDIYPTNLTLLSVNYYDNYTYYGAPNPLPNEVEEQDLLNNVKGLATGSWVRVLDSPTQHQGELNYVLYDKKSRPIRSHTENYLGGFTQVDSALDFAGKTNHSITTHERSSSSDSLTVLDAYEYDAQDRLSIHTQQINNLEVETIAVNTYDELGQLIGKDIGGGSRIFPLQKVNYSYNIRGWLKRINDIINLAHYSDPIDLFAFKINYNDPDGSESNAGDPLYNGNISQTSWRTSTDNVLRRYRYGYDSMNRLSSAVYQKPGHTISSTNMYNESMSYDKNGNIQALQRNGDLDAVGYSVNQIDQLTYSYDGYKKNQLMKVTDNTNNPKGFKDDSSGWGSDTTDDYSYDANGNMLSDENKNITGIAYNHLNLPTQIQFGTINKIEYLYDATGRKKRKVVTAGTNITTTDYLDGFQYTDAMLSFFSDAEGYVNVTYCEECETESKLRFNYVYQYKDHLGNIRVSYGYDEHDEVLKIIEENHYYPFGLKHTSYNTGEMKYELLEENEIQLTPLAAGERVLNNYRYNGKEWQDELSLNVYDYDNRVYDPAIGRFWEMDPLAEQGRRWSPYNYCFNNPIYFQDPDGMWPTLPSWSDVKKSYNQAKATVAKTYNETKKAVVETKDKVVASTKETLKEGQQWVKDNKKEILNVANNMQDAGDGIAIAGYGAAVVGAPIAGVGAAPGATVAAFGNGLALLGSGIEIATNLIAGDNGAAGQEAGFVAGGMVIDAVVDRVLPGPTPDMSKEATTILKEGINVKTILTERVIKKSQEEKK